MGQDQLMTALFLSAMLVSLPRCILTFQESGLPAARAPPPFLSLPSCGLEGMEFEWGFLVTFPHCSSVEMIQG